jgi:predicted HNH restriction endonuclease
MTEREPELEIKVLMEVNHEQAELGSFTLTESTWKTDFPTKLRQLTEEAIIEFNAAQEEDKNE